MRQNAKAPPVVFPAQLARISRHLSLLAGILLTLGGSLLSKTSASQSPPEVLNIKTYASASGEYLLEVDPTDIYGRGPGKYRLMINGKEAWSATLPFTLHEAVVTNDGSSVGYAYQHGEEGFAKEGGYAAGPGDLHVVILDSRGGLRLNQVTSREHSGILHTPPYPLVNGILLREEEDMFTIRATTWLDESWWTYRISDGKALRRFPIRGMVQYSNAARSIEAAKLLPGTPLSLLHVRLHDWKKKQSGALFLLMDQDGKPVWSLDLPADYTVGRDSMTERRIEKALELKGAILNVAENGRFELWFAAESQSVTFQVSQGVGERAEWQVVETGRRPYELPPLAEVQPQIKERPLKRLGTFKLKVEMPAGPIPGVDGFEFDFQGRIGMVRREEARGRYLFVLLDSAGKPLAEMLIPAVLDKERHMQVHVVAVSKEKWVIVASDPAGKDPSRAWWFDSEKKTFSDSVALDCPDIKAVAATGDGGFVVLGTRHLPYTLVDELHAFDAAGRPRWKRGEAGYDGAESSLLSPEDLTVTRDKEIAVLDNIRKKVQFFDLAGEHRRTVDLEKTWGREPNYPTGIMPDLEGGFIVYDFNGAQRFVRMRADGSLLGPFQPRYRDGRQIDADRIRIAPDGRLWTTDSHSLLRLDGNGLTDQMLGSLPDEDKLGVIGGVTGDRHGNLYAVDERTGAVHIFDADGRKLRICKPAAGDFPEHLRSPAITVADDGGVYLRQDSFSSLARYLYFTPDGTRQGFKEFKLDGSREEWFCQTGTDNFLVLQYQAALLVNPKGKVLTRIERRSDRQWLDYAADAAVASDGSFAILSRSTSEDDSRSAVALYARDGTPVRTFPLPGGMEILTGYNGKHIVVRTLDRTRERLTIYDRQGSLVHSFAPSDLGNGWGMFLTRGGRELWIVEFLARKVHRYAMPR